MKDILSAGCCVALSSGIQQVGWFAPFRLHLGHCSLKYVGGYSSEIRFSVNAKGFLYVLTVLGTGIRIHLGQDCPTSEPPGTASCTGCGPCAAHCGLDAMGAAWAPQDWTHLPLWPYKPRPAANPAWVISHPYHAAGAWAASSLGLQLCFPA